MKPTKARRPGCVGMQRYAGDDGILRLMSAAPTLSGSVVKYSVVRSTKYQQRRSQGGRFSLLLDFLKPQHVLYAQPTKYPVPPLRSCDIPWASGLTQGGARLGWKDANDCEHGASTSYRGVQRRGSCVCRASSGGKSEGTSLNGMAVLLRTTWPNRAP